MSAFTSPTDIKNRALDHLGARHVTGAADGSRNSTIIDPLYDKLRQAELERNLWTFATSTVALRPIGTTTMVFVPEAWASATQYNPADIVSYLGSYWITLSQNQNVPPIDANGVVASQWDNYFGPQTVDQWVNPSSSPAGTITNNFAYHAGELAYIAPGNGTASVFVSLIDGNTEDPLAGDAWVSTTVYMAGQLVLGSDSVLYQSLVNLNQGNDPTVSFPAAAWASATTYSIGQNAIGADGMIYTSLQNSNTNNSPPNTTWWKPTNVWSAVWSQTITPQPRSTSNNWHFLTGASLTPLAIVYPLGAGPAQQSISKNIFMLPYGYLKQAPTDLKHGTVPWVGGPRGATPDDWIFQDRFLVSATTTPILMRFVRDFQNVALMKPMFCEGLGARLAFEACEAITQATDKQQIVTSIYRGVMGEARTANAIEAGPIDPPVDDWILVRA